MKRRALMRVGGLIIGLMFTVFLVATVFFVAPASASTIISISSGSSSYGTFDGSPDGDASGGVFISPPSSAPAAQNNPIPSTLLLLASGLGGVVAYRKKFKT